MLAVLYIIGFLFLAQTMFLQATIPQYTPEDMLSAIQQYEDNVTSTTQKNTDQNLVSSAEATVGPIKDFSTIKILCKSAIILDHLFYLSKHLIGAGSFFFGEAALGGDRFTGNAFVEGLNDKSLIAIKLNKTLLDTKHISLQELFEIFERLDDDITARYSDYLDHRSDKSEILHVLQRRKQRLLDNFHLLENHTFHFHKHTSLHEYQRKIALTAMILTPIICSLLFTASYDLETSTWQSAMPELIQKNSSFLLKKILPST